MASRNSVMVKLKREPDLIRFSSEAADQDGRKHRLLRPRSAIYAVALCALITLSGDGDFTPASAGREATRLNSRGRPLMPLSTRLIDQPVGFAILNQSPGGCPLPADVPGSVLQHGGAGDAGLEQRKRQTRIGDQVALAAGDGHQVQLAPRLHDYTDTSRWRCRPSRRRPGGVRRARLRIGQRAAQRCRAGAAEVGRRFTRAISLQEFSPP